MINPEEVIEYTGATERIALEPMRELVYGRPRRRLPTRLIFVAAVVLSTYGCATVRRPVVEAAETVGQLAPSYASIATAPIHHDAPPELGGVAGGDDDGPQGDSSLDVLRREAATAGAIEVSAKTDGVTIGGAR